MDRMKKMMENMSEEERVKMMERCFEFMKGKEPGKNEERDEKKREETACIPDMGKIADCCLEVMETFISKVMSRFEGKAKEEKKDTDEKTEDPGCCQRN
jgi:hypothetical protein